MTTMLDIHKKECTCSYCKGQHGFHYGLNIPIRWNECNSWYVIKFSPRVYFRWTNRWFKFFTKSKNNYEKFS